MASAETNLIAPEPKVDLSKMQWPEQLLYSTVRLVSQTASGAYSIGTGFVVNLFQTETGSVATLITNKHVIKNCITGSLTFHAKDQHGLPILESFCELHISDIEKSFIPHPDAGVDLAAYPLGGAADAIFNNTGKRLYIIGFGSESILTEEYVQENCNPLEDVYVVGYPDGLVDPVSNFPVFRRGITASPPYLGFMGQTDFLIDCAIYPGSSGSPVYLHSNGFMPNRHGEMKPRFGLLGIVKQVYEHTVDGTVTIVEAPTNAGQVARSAIPNNLGICVKAERILDFEPIIVKMGFSPPAGYTMKALKSERNKP